MHPAYPGTHFSQGRQERVHLLRIPHDHRKRYCANVLHSAERFWRRCSFWASAPHRRPSGFRKPFQEVTTMTHSRRSFLEAGLALPAVLAANPSLATAVYSTESAAAKDSSFDPWVEIHRENLRHNVQEISRRTSVRPILAVIKNNGFGMGVTNVAQLLEPQPEIFGFAVVKLHEAVSLRDAGIRKPILLLGPFDEQNLTDAVARGIMPLVYT